MVEATRAKKRPGKGSVNPFLPTVEQRMTAEIADPHIVYEAEDEAPEKKDHGSGLINEFLPTIDEKKDISLQKEIIAKMGDELEIDLGGGMKLVRYGHPGVRETVKLKIESDQFENPINVESLPYEEQKAIRVALAGRHQE